MTKLEKGKDVGVAHRKKRRKTKGKIITKISPNQIKLLPNKGLEKSLKVLEKKKFKEPTKANKVKLEMAKKALKFSTRPSSDKIFN